MTTDPADPVEVLRDHLVRLLMDDFTVSPEGAAIDAEYIVEWMETPANRATVVAALVAMGVLVQPRTPEWSDLGAVLDKHGEATWMACPHDGARPLYMEAP